MCTVFQPLKILNLRQVSLQHALSATGNRWADRSTIRAIRTGIYTTIFCIWNTWRDSLFYGNNDYNRSCYLPIHKHFLI